MSIFWCKVCQNGSKQNCHINLLSLLYSMRPIYQKKGYTSWTYRTGQDIIQFIMHKECIYLKLTRLTQIPQYVFTLNFRILDRPLSSFIHIGLNLKKDKQAGLNRATLEINYRLFLWSFTIVQAQATIHLYVCWVVAVAGQSVKSDYNTLYGLPMGLSSRPSVAILVMVDWIKFIITNSSGKHFRNS